MSLRPGDVVHEIASLPRDWHGAGTMSEPVLQAMVSHLENFPVTHSAETGSGKTTLLFSHFSSHHTVFASEYDNRSITVVRQSPLLRAGAVEFVVGPTQVTLPLHRFEHPLQAALIDGPHGYPFPELEYYYLYPALAPGALLIVDDIHIPTIGRLAEFLEEDEMFESVEVVEHTAFFRRSKAPVFDPLGDGWWLQRFNTSRMRERTARRGLRKRVGAWLPEPAKRALKRMIASGK